MGLFNRKPKVLTPEQAEEIYTKDFFDMILPSTIKFFTDYYIVGDSYRSVWAVQRISAEYGRTGNIITACRQKRSNSPHISQACGKYGTEKNHTECHTQKQAKVRW